MYRKKKKKNITQTFICYQVFPSGQLSFSVLINLVSLSIDFFPVSVFEWHNPQGIKFLTRLCLGLSHLLEHKFNHSFQDLLNQLCNCSAEVESTSHFLLHCPIYNNDGSYLLSTIKNIDCKLLEITDSSLSQALLYGNHLLISLPIHSS